MTAFGCVGCILFFLFFRNLFAHSPGQVRKCCESQSLASALRLCCTVPLGGGSVILNLPRGRAHRLSAQQHVTHDRTGGTSHTPAHHGGMSGIGLSFCPWRPCGAVPGVCSLSVEMQSVRQEAFVVLARQNLWQQRFEQDQPFSTLSQKNSRTQSLLLKLPLLFKSLLLQCQQFLKEMQTNKSSLKTLDM